MKAFRWRSWLGAAAVLFLLYGAVNVAAAIFVPTTLVTGGATAVNVSSDGDTYLVGGEQVMNALRHDNPKLDTLLRGSMVSMCSQMMAYGIVTILATWFAIRRGQAWAVWAVALAALAEVPYYAVIASMYAARERPSVGSRAWCRSMSGWWLRWRSA